MGSRTHTFGYGAMPATIGQNNFATVLARQAQLNADNRFAVYVAPLGGNMHLVKNVCNDTTYRVGSAVGMTFSPGQSVVLGSANGAPGEVIIGIAPPGAQGASNLPISFSVRSSFVAGAPRSASCPVALSARPYLGLFTDSGAGTVQAYAYTDGTKGAKLSEVATDIYPQSVRVSSIESGIVTLVGSSTPEGFISSFVTWVLPSTITEATLGEDTAVSFLLQSGRILFYRQWIDDGYHLQLYSIPVGFNGAVNLETSKVGSEYLDHSVTDIELFPPLLSPVEGRYLLAGGPAGSLSFSGGTWSTYSPSYSTNLLFAGRWPGRGYAVLSVDAVVQLAPTPPGAVVQLTGEDWGITGILNPRVSLSGKEMMAYPLYRGDEDSPNHYLWRIALQSAPFADECEVHRILVDRGGPSDSSPEAMIPLD